MVLLFFEKHFIVCNRNTNLRLRLVVRYHAEGLCLLLVVAVVLVPGGAQGLLLHQEQVARAGVQLVQRARVNGFLEKKYIVMYGFPSIDLSLLHFLDSLVN